MNKLIGIQTGISKKNVPYMMLHTIGCDEHNISESGKSWIGFESFSPIYVPDDGSVEIVGQPKVGCEVRILNEGQGSFSKVSMVVFKEPVKK